MIRKAAFAAAGLVALSALTVWHFPVLFPQATTALSPRLAYQLSEAALVAKQLGQAEALARQSLRFNPLEVANIGLIARVSEERGDRVRAGSIMSLAAAYSWRDQQVQRWLFTAAAATGASQEMILRADALARRSQGQDISIPVLYLGALDKATSGMVADRIAANAPYRAGFFLLSRNINADDFDAYEDFIDLLAKRGSPLTDFELLPYVQRLFDEAEVARAEHIWFRDRPDPKSGQILRDPTFARFGESIGANRNPFGWVQPSEGMSVEFFVGSPEGASEIRALNIRSSEYGPLDILSQVVRLPQSRYEFTIERKIEEGDTDSLKWKLICIADRQSIEPVSATVDDAADWERVAYRFELSDCHAYRLVAFLDNPAADRQSVWIREPTLRPARRAADL